MAILSKIRERSLFLIIIIAVALFAFVLTGLFDANSPLFNKNTNAIGEINGESISREEFAQLVDQQRAGNRNSSSQLQNVNTAWDNLVRQKVYETQLKKSGIVVGEKDVWDEILKQPFIQNNPQFKNEAGLFDQEKVKEYIAEMKDNAANGDEQGKMMWLQWLGFERNIKTNLELSTYSNLIKSGLSATIKDGERDYLTKNTKIDLELVQIPFSKISDSLVKVTDEEIKNYVKQHKEQYKSEAARNISFVKFDIKATPEDENAIKGELAKLINDREEYNKAAKTNMNVLGFANTTEIAQFFRDNDSDTPYDANYYTKSRMLKTLADTVFSLNKGDIYGPYKEGEFFKLTKLVDVKQLPDSVKSRHILIPFAGARNADPAITKTEEQAKKVADSLLNIIKSDKSKFEGFVKEFSSDKGSVEKGGKYDWYPYNRMTPEFRDYTFEGNVGDLGVVKSPFGFHIIEIEGQKNKQRALQLATFSRKIIPSEETENAIFEQAETFASNAVNNSKDFVNIAKEKNYSTYPLYGLKEMSEYVSVLGNQREIVKWVFEDNTNENDVKRFDIDNGYAVVKLDKKIKKGLSIGNSKASIRTILINKKKAKLIKDKINSLNSLADIAKAYNTNVSSSKTASVSSPALTQVGRAPELINILSSLKTDKLYKNIEVKDAIYAVKVSKITPPQTMTSYTSFIRSITQKLQSKGNKAYEAIKKSSNIEDNRAVFY